MKIESKISGWRITDFKITPIFDSQFINLKDVIAKIKKQETMNYILDEFRFTRGEVDGEWFAIFDYDTIYKISIMENYPEYEKELKEHFGENWSKHYLRFNH